MVAAGVEFTLRWRQRFLAKSDFVTLFYSHKIIIRGTLIIPAVVCISLLLFNVLFIA